MYRRRNTNQRLEDKHQDISSGSLHYQIHVSQSMMLVMSEGLTQCRKAPLIIISVPPELGWSEAAQTGSLSRCPAGQAAGGPQGFGSGSCHREVTPMTRQARAPCRARGAAAADSPADRRQPCHGGPGRRPLSARGVGPAGAHQCCPVTVTARAILTGSRSPPPS
jgi:hypothetical protein